MRSKTPNYSSSGRVVNFNLPSNTSNNPTIKKPQNSSSAFSHANTTQTPSSSSSLARQNIFHKTLTAKSATAFLDEEEDPHSFKFNSPSHNNNEIPAPKLRNPLPASSSLLKEQNVGGGVYSTGGLEPKFAPGVMNMFSSFQDTPILFSGYADKWLPPQQRVSALQKQKSMMQQKLHLADAIADAEARNAQYNKFYQQQQQHNSFSSAATARTSGGLTTSRSQPCHVLTKGPQIILAIGQKGIYLLPKERLDLRDVAELVIHEHCGSSAITQGGSPVFEFRMINHHQDSQPQQENLNNNNNSSGNGGTEDQKNNQIHSKKARPTVQEDGIAPVVHSRFVTFGGEYIAHRVASVLRIVAPDLPVVVHTSYWPIVNSSNNENGVGATSSPSAGGDDGFVVNSNNVFPPTSTNNNNLAQQKNNSLPRRPETPSTKVIGAKMLQKPSRQQALSLDPSSMSSGVNSNNLSKYGDDDHDDNDNRNFAVDVGNNNPDELKRAAAQRWQLLRRNAKNAMDKNSSTTATAPSSSNLRKGANNSASSSTPSPTKTKNSNVEPQDSWSEFLQSRDSIRRRIGGSTENGNGFMASSNTNASLSSSSQYPSGPGAGHLYRVYADELANDLVRMQGEIDQFLDKFGSVQESAAMNGRYLQRL